MLCWSCECYSSCVKEQWAKNHLVHLCSQAKTKDIRTESLATGPVSPLRQKPNEMQHWDDEWTISDEQDAWHNSVAKVRNGELQEVKKISVIDLLSESRSLPRGEENLDVVDAKLRVLQPSTSVKAVVLPHPFAHFSTALHLPPFTLPLLIFTASNQTFPALGWMEHSAFLRMSLTVIGSLFQKCLEQAFG